MSENTRAPLEMTIRAELDGWPIDLALSLPADKVRTALARLAELGYTPRRDGAPAAPQAEQRRPARSKVEPVYQPDGTPCCPIHLKPLSEGRYGLYCSAKVRPGEEGNDKGYCAIRFTE